MRVDKQGRLVVPQHLREGLVDVPGEVLLSRTSDGLLIQPTTAPGTVSIAEDGLPVLALDRVVTNAEVLTALDAERYHR